MAVVCRVVLATNAWVCSIPIHELEAETIVSSIQTDVPVPGASLPFVVRQNDPLWEYATSIAQPEWGIGRDWRR